MQKVVPLFTTENPSALVDRAEFTDRIALLARLCARPMHPILGHVRVSSETGGLAFIATNSSLQAETSMTADTDARFSAALPAAALLKLMKKGTPSNHAILELTAEDGAVDERFVAAKCAVHVGTTRFVIDVMPTGDFPEPIRHAEGSKIQRFSIPSAVLWNAIDGTLDAVSTDETRRNLNGVYLHDYHGRLRFAATDGHRLYIQDSNVQTGKSEISAILPTDGAKFVASLLDGYAGADPVQVELSGGVAVFVFRGMAVTMNLVDGPFPDYGRVIPTDPDKKVAVAGGALSEAVAALAEGASAELVRLAFSESEIAITVTGASGEGSVVVDCSYEGDEFTIAFDAKNLRSAIEAASPDGRKMIIRMKDAASPALVSGSIGGWTGVLMPSAA
ncbi:UNVERIFIED_ORG: DNA polymerase III subunit beta [Roseateles sp. XES5]|nr:DNA polymerase III subunit beta [Roseateles sp. XES5]